MTKKEAIFIAKEKAKYEGYITHLLVLEIYDDDEEIPKEVFDLVCHKPTPTKPIIMFSGEMGIKMIEQACEDYIRVMTIEEIKENIKNNPIN